jgi:hypothetical protein
MKTVCAWCSKILFEDEAGDALLSHGICAECLQELLGPTKLHLTEFLNSIELPILVTDETRAIRQINYAAERALGRVGTEAGGASVGVAIECLHAGVMGECGFNAYCAGCSFRRNISDTYADGKPRYGEYVQHNIQTATGAKARCFRFSTAKLGDMVMVSIEGIQEIPDEPKLGEMLPGADAPLISTPEGDLKQCSPTLASARHSQPGKEAGAETAVSSVP